jgi:uncharacterized membrane protein YdbT with pleckstrin-like domain
MAPSAETPVWTGSPSQWLNFGAFFLCALLAAAFVTGAILAAIPPVAYGVALPALIALWKWAKVRGTKISVTTERITSQVGVLSRHRWDMELYRVKDTTLHEPFLLRLVGLANIELESSDRTTPTMVLPALHNAEDLRQKIRANVERLRAIRGVREMDMDVER